MGPLDEARVCVEEIERHRDAISALALKRREAIQAAMAEGMSQYAIARALGVTQQAVAKILKRGSAATMRMESRPSAVRAGTTQTDHSQPFPPSPASLPPFTDRERHCLPDLDAVVSVVVPGSVEVGEGLWYPVGDVRRVR